MKLSTLLIGTGIVSLFWAWFYVSFTESLLKGDLKEMMVAIGILAGLVTVGWFIRRAKKIKPAERIAPEYPFGMKPQVPARGPVFQLLSIPEDVGCDDARRDLIQLQQRLAFEVDEMDVRKDPALKARYGDQVPVLLFDGVQMFSYQMDGHTLEVRLQERAQGVRWTGGSTWEEGATQ